MNLKFRGLSVLAASSLLAGCASVATAQPAGGGALVNPVAPAAEPAAPAGPLTVDQLLDLLDARGKNLKSFVADVTLIDENVNLGNEERRTGKIWFERRADGTARIRVTFTEWTDGKVVRPEKIEYLLDGGWLTDRNYKQKIEVRRQVLKPGEKMDLFKLGDGPFPLPIGQAKDEVKKQFDVKPAKPRKSDPPGTQHLELRPNPGTGLARKFSLIDVFVDPKTQMPARVTTTDTKGQNSRGTDLKNLQVNPALKDEDFKLERTGADWNVKEEPMRE